MSLIAIIVSFVALTFVLACSLTIGMGRLEKAGLALVLLGIGTASAVFMFLPANPYAKFSSFAEFEKVFQNIQHGLNISEAALVVTLFGFVLTFIGASYRSWKHRRSLFPFLFSSHKRL